MNLGEMLTEAAHRHGEKIVIVQGESRFSYHQLDEDSNKLANGLKTLGITRGDRVVMLLDNSYRFVVIYFALVRLGASAVPLDPKYKTLELETIFENCRPVAILTEGACVSLASEMATRFDFINIVVDISPRPVDRLPNYQKLMQSSPTAVNEAQNGDVAHIAYTSGPTLRPKGVMLIQERLVAGAFMSAGGFKQTESDVVALFALPMHHAVGMVVIVLTSVSQGSTVVIVPGFSFTSLFNAILKEKVSILIGVPFVHSLLLREIEEKKLKINLDSVRVCASAGAPLEMKTIKRFKKAMGRILLQFYGLTEATVHVTCQELDGSGTDGAVGRTLPQFEIKVVDDESNILETGEVGEVMIKGPFMKGYYNNEEATATAIEDGWLHTGDLGRFDENGELYIVALKKPMLISKGQNIYFSDVEDVLAGHPAVAAVRVTGIADPDGMRGEVVRAVIELKDDTDVSEAEIRKYCLDRIANYKTPKQVVFTDSISDWQDTTLVVESGSHIFNGRSR